MSKTLLSAAILFIVPTSASAGDFFVSDTHVLYEPRGLTTITPEYAWGKGKCGGFGFLDVYSEGSLEYITNHTVDCEVTKGFFVSTEAGFSNFGTAFKFGGGIALPLPGMVFTKVTWYPEVMGDGGDTSQVKVTWMSEDISVTSSTELYFSGFARFRKGTPNIVQPQVWFKNEKWPVEIGSEVSMYGRDTTIQIALKYNF